MDARRSSLGVSGTNPASRVCDAGRVSRGRRAGGLGSSGRQCRGGHAEVPFVVLVPDGNSQIHHPGVIRIGSDAELQQFAAC